MMIRIRPADVKRDEYVVDGWRRCVACYGSGLHGVSVEVGHDDLTIDDVMSDLVRPALLGFSFAEKTVGRCFGEEEE